MDRFPLPAGRFCAAAMLAAILGIVGLIGGGAGQAQKLSGDPTKGKEIAGRACVGCHAGDQKPGRVPTLEKIANTPHYTMERLRRIIAVPPHQTMPNLSLTPAEIDDLAAYITSLRKPTK